ncbi:MAG TPA: response regulator, partial [Rhodospirillales bacterium]|nr:response regulator [Rhodospirillales bacterium]
MSGVGTIMIVDDDPSNTEVLSSILEPDYEVLFAENGERALEEIHNK